MSMDRIPMSRGGYDKLKGELNQLEHEEMPRIAKEIGHTRGFGDLSENAEFHAAVEAQGMLNARIRNLRDKLNRAYLIDTSTLPSDQVVFGARVRVKDLDLDEDHLVVGAMGSLQLLRASTLEPIARKRIGRVTAIARAPNGHTVVLLIGTEGRIIWFDCDRAKAVSELSVPHFSHAISDGSRVFLQLGQLTKYEPRAIGAGGEKVYVPPIDLVEPGGGVGVVDLARRSLVAEYEMPRSTIKPWPLQLSSSRERLFVLAATGSSRLIRSIRLANGEVEFDWQLPETAIPLAALREGERAIIADERMNWQRILLVERD